LGFIATALFVCIFVFGADVFGYSDDNGQVRLAIFATFLFGLLAGYRARD
jgi:hypothetical protein